MRKKSLHTSSRNPPRTLRERETPQGGPSFGYLLAVGSPGRLRRKRGKTNLPPLASPPFLFGVKCRIGERGRGRPSLIRFPHQRRPSTKGESNQPRNFPLLGSRVSKRESRKPAGYPRPPGQKEEKGGRGAARGPRGDVGRRRRRVAARSPPW